jgi:GDP-L-fucose synthase
MSKYLTQQDRIYVAGHRGLVGSGIHRRLVAGGYANIITRTHKELELLDQAAVRAFFAQERPTVVVIAAAKVGGILANNTYRAQFIYENLMIQNHLIHGAWEAGVKRLLFLASSCIYPKHCPQPMREDHLLTGPLEPTNEPYAVAKIAGIKMCGAYNSQYGTDYMSVMPSNMYGPGDNYDLQSSHVLPAIIRKMHEAKLAGSKQVELWGSGTPRREFLYSDDLADACVYLLENVTSQDTGEVINVGYGEDVTIRELADVIAKVVGFKGEPVYDATKPDGTPKKCMDISRIRSLGWAPKTSLLEGVERSYRDFLARGA